MSHGVGQKAHPERQALQKNDRCHEPPHYPRPRRQVGTRQEHPGRTNALHAYLRSQPCVSCMNPLLRRERHSRRVTPTAEMHDKVPSTPNMIVNAPKIAPAAAHNAPNTELVNAQAHPGRLRLRASRWHPQRNPGAASSEPKNGTNAPHIPSKAPTSRTCQMAKGDTAIIVIVGNTACCHTSRLFAPPVVPASVMACPVYAR